MGRRDMSFSFKSILLSINIDNSATYKNEKTTNLIQYLKNPETHTGAENLTIANIFTSLFDENYFSFNTSLLAWSDRTLGQIFNRKLDRGHIKGKEILEPIVKKITENADETIKSVKKALMIFLNRNMAEEIKSTHSVFQFVTVNSFGNKSAEKLVNYINRIKYDDPYLALTLLLIISLFPIPASDSNERDLLESVITTEILQTQHDTTISDENRIVTPQKLWNAGQRTYQQSTSSSGRFRLLDVNERIMPFYSKEDKRLSSCGVELPINVRMSDSEDDLSLRDALRTGHGNYYLIGEGGIGKTTAMFRIMEQYYKKPYDPSKEIPLFVELSRAPGKSGLWYEGTEVKSRFIRMEICRQLLDCDELADVSYDFVKCITNEFKSSSDDIKPKYLLLLDGLNEVSMNYVVDSHNNQKLPDYVRRLIIDEINFLIESCPNVRVMLTSRTDETDISCSEHKFEKLYLTGLKETPIRQYLLKKEFTVSQIDSALSNESLAECLIIPLFLTMYAKLNDVEGVTSRGEILNRFFHERSDVLKREYTQKNRLDAINKNDLSSNNRFRFIIDFLLPAIASTMEYDNEFKISAETAADVIEPILHGKAANGSKPENKPHPCAIIGEFGKQCFANYNGLNKIASDLLSIDNDMIIVAEYILKIAVTELGILYRDKNAEYGFIHHHFRDYFAAVQDINLMRIALRAHIKKSSLALEGMMPMIKHANHIEKSLFIGEILGEHHNKPYLQDGIWEENVPTSDEDRSLITQTLDVLRGVFGNEIGYGVYNLIEPIKLVRQDMSCCDFSELDLSHISFNGYCLGHTESDGAFFQGAKLGITNFLHQGHHGWVKCIVCEPTTGRTFLSGSHDGTIKEWDMATKQCICTYETNGSPIDTIAYSPDGKSFLSGSTNGIIMEWRIGEGKSVQTYKGHTAWVNAIVYSKNGQRFLSCSRDNTIKEWQTGNPNCICTYSEHQEWVTCVAYEPKNGKTFISSSYDGTVKEWRIGVKTSKRTYRIDGFTPDNCQHLFCVAYNPQEKSFIAGTSDSKIIEWQVGNSQSIRTYQGHEGCINCLSYEPKRGQTFVSGSDDGTIMEWQIGNSTKICSYKGHEGKIYAITYVPSGTGFLSGAYDGNIMQWQTGRINRIHVYRGNARWNKVTAYAPDGKSFLSGADDGTIQEWDVATGHIICTYTGHSQGVQAIAYAPDGKSFLSGSCDNSIKEWQVGKSECVFTYQEHDQWVRALAYAPDGKTFISGSYDHLIKEWRIHQAHSICTYKGHEGHVYAVAFGSDGKSFISGSYDKTIKEWTVGNPECIRTYRGHDNWVMSVAFEPKNGCTFISSSADGTIKEWQRGNNESIFTYLGHTKWIKALAYAPNGKTFISGSYDGTIRKWEIVKKDGIVINQEYHGDIYTIAYSPIGTTILSGSSDDTIRIWSTENNECLRIIRHYSGLYVRGCDMRNLHPDSVLSDEDKEILSACEAIVE